MMDDHYLCFYSTKYTPSRLLNIIAIMDKNSLVQNWDSTFEASNAEQVLKSHRSRDLSRGGVKSEQNSPQTIVISFTGISRD